MSAEIRKFIVVIRFIRENVSAAREEKKMKHICFDYITNRDQHWASKLCERFGKQKKVMTNVR